MAYTSQPPLEQNLLITTPNAIIHHSQVTNRVLFECDTADSIANCAASRDNSSLFAIADSQVVILHDAARGRDKKYKLKNGDVRHQVS
jgi:hypothetical protein